MTSIKANRLKVLIIASIAFLSLGFESSISLNLVQGQPIPETIFSDNFDSYPAGTNLSGGGSGSWVGRWGGNISVTTEASLSPPQSAKMDNGSGCWESQLYAPLPYNDVTWFSADIMGKATGRTGCHEYDAMIRLFNPNQGGTWGSHMMAFALMSGPGEFNIGPGLIAQTSYFATGSGYAWEDLINLEPNYQGIVDQWINVMAKVDAIENQADVWVNGIYRGSLSMSLLCPSYAGIALDCGEGIGYVDNVNVFINGPNPGDDAVTLQPEIPYIMPTNGGQYHFFKLESEPGKDLIVTLDQQMSENGSLEFYGRAGIAPVRFHYDFHDQNQNNQLHQELYIPSTPDSKTYYFLVYDSNSSGGTSSFTLLANYLGFFLSNITPTKGGNSGNVTIRLRGSGFTADTTVKLMDSKGNAIKPVNKIFTDSTDISATFDLTNRTPGIYNVVVSKPGANDILLPGGFTIETGGEARLWVEIIGSNQIRVGRQQDYLFKYGNSGDIDIEDVVISVFYPEVVDLLNSVSNTSFIAQNDEIESSCENPQGRGYHRIIKRVPSQSMSSFKLGFRISTPSGLLTIFLKACWGMVAAYLESLALQLSGQDPAVSKEQVNQLYQEFMEDEVNQNLSLEEFAERFGEFIQEKLKVAIDVVALLNNFNEISKLGDKLPSVTCDDCDQQDIQSVISYDPNEKVGPTGFDLVGTNPDKQIHFIAGYYWTGYMVYFENLETATAAVQDMSITDQLDSNMDWSTFSFDTIQIGTHTISVQEGSQNFGTVIDLRPDIPAIVQVQCSFDQQTGLAQWYFKGVDPLGGDFADFLPPNTESVDPKGRGWVSYSVKPLPNLPTGTVIKNKATIDFEVGIPPAPMDTPEVFNTIDNTKPTSQVLTLPNIEKLKNFNVSWSGSDEGSGVRDYTIYVSDNQGPYTPWLTQTTNTSATFTGLHGHTYAFYSVARDNVGNQQDPPPTPDAKTTVWAICPIVNLTEDQPETQNLLREYRDKVLRKFPAGREYVNLFYQHSLELTSIILKNPSIASEAKEILFAILPEVRSAVEGRGMVIASAQTKKINFLLNVMGKEASPKLQKDIRRLKGDLRQKRIFKELNITQ